MRKSPQKILNGEINNHEIYNIVYPTPITVIELAELIKKIVEEETNKKISPEINVINSEKLQLYTPDDKNKIKVDISKATKEIELKNLQSPQDSLRRIIKNRIHNV